MHSGVGCGASCQSLLQQAKVVPSTNVLTARSPRGSQQHYFCLHSNIRGRAPITADYSASKRATRRQTRLHMWRGAPLGDGGTFPFFS